MFSIGPVQLDSNLLLAPIAGYCDLPTRLLVRSIPGATLPDGTQAPSLGLACTDLLCPEAILNEADKTMWLAATHDDDKPVTMQLYGRHPESLNPAAEWAVKNGANVVDVNMGCPVDKVTKKNGGSKLLTEPCLAVDIIKGLVRTLEGTGVPVTAKIRLGWCDDSLIVDSLPLALADAGVKAITVHGRTTEQKFRGHVRLPGIAQVVESVRSRFSPDDVKIIGNGDIQSPEAAKTMLDETGCDGLMIGRGALRQPWLFRDIGYYLKTGQHAPAIPRVRKAEYVLEHLLLLRKLKDDRYALNKLRQRISWYSAQIQPWPHLRRDVQAIKDADELQAFLTQGIETMRHHENNKAHHHQQQQQQQQQQQPVNAATSS